MAHSYALLCVDTSQSMWSLFEGTQNPFASFKAYVMRRFEEIIDPDHLQVNDGENDVYDVCTFGFCCEKIYSFMTVRQFMSIRSEKDFLGGIHNNQPFDAQRIMDNIREMRLMEQYEFVSILTSAANYERLVMRYDISGGEDHLVVDKKTWDGLCWYTTSQKNMICPEDGYVFMQCNESVEEPKSLLSIFEGEDKPKAEGPKSLLAIFEGNTPANQAKIQQCQTGITVLKKQIVDLQKQIANKQDQIIQLEKQIVDAGGSIEPTAQQQAQTQQPAQQNNQGGNANESESERYDFSLNLFESVKDGKTDALYEIVTQCYEDLPALSYHPDEKSRRSFAKILLSWINEQDWTDGLNHWPEVSEKIRIIIDKSVDVSMSRRETDKFTERLGVLLKDSMVFGWIFGREFARKYMRQQVPQQPQQI